MTSMPTVCRGEYHVSYSYSNKRSGLSGLTNPYAVGGSCCFLRGDSVLFDVDDDC